MDDLVATGELLQPDEARSDGFVLQGQFVRYRHVYKGVPVPHIEISRRETTGERFARWEVKGLPAGAPETGDIADLMHTDSRRPTMRGADQHDEHGREQRPARAGRALGGKGAAAWSRRRIRLSWCSERRSTIRGSAVPSPRSGSE